MSRTHDTFASSIHSRKNPSRLCRSSLPSDWIPSSPSPSSRSDISESDGLDVGFSYEHGDSTCSSNDKDSAQPFLQLDEPYQRWAREVETGEMGLENLDEDIWAERSDSCPAVVVDTTKEATTAKTNQSQLRRGKQRKVSQRHGRGDVGIDVWFQRQRDRQTVPCHVSASGIEIGEYTALRKSHTSSTTRDRAHSRQFGRHGSSMAHFDVNAYTAFANQTSSGNIVKAAIHCKPLGRKSSRSYADSSEDEVVYGRPEGRFWLHSVQVPSSATEHSRFAGRRKKSLRTNMRPSTIKSSAQPKNGVLLPTRDRCFNAKRPRTADTASSCSDYADASSAVLDDDTQTPLDTDYEEDQKRDAWIQGAKGSKANAQKIKGFSKQEVVVDDEGQAKPQAQYKDSFKYNQGLATDLPPIHAIDDIFADITNKALQAGLQQKVLSSMGTLRVATMCSGTESPLLALTLVQNVLQSQGHVFDFEHVFSAEIVPFKQAYIERNFSVDTIFRDIRELAQDGVHFATNAYGAKVKIPTDIDLLVAGFSCVDFSRLNGKNLTLEQGGESGDTLSAIFAYAQKYKPKIVVLENVKGAPWKQIAKEILPKYGYVGESQIVDTKDYYIPQTRQRGYMLCFLAELADVRQQHDIVSQWSDLIRKFERKASSPVDAFLLNKADDRLLAGRMDVSRPTRGDKGRTGTVDWTRCSARHDDYRGALNLGLKRPVTNWQDGGSMKGPDYMWREWSVSQVERIWDTISIAHLRNQKRGFDDRFKSRNLELSQNVDRVTDTIKAGIIGCVTPTGIPFNTFYGRPLLGIECLALQGLPIDQLSLSREPQAKLQDLAGNAMSTTVVGVAILSALIAAHALLPTRGTSHMSINKVPKLSTLSEDDQLISFDTTPTAYRPTLAEEVFQQARRAAAMCLCEGSSLVTSIPIQRCRDCKHTSCTSCGVDRSHRNVRVGKEELATRISPVEFAMFIKRSLPMRMRIDGLCYDTLRELHEHDESSLLAWKYCEDNIHSAILSDFKYHSLSRSEIWVVRYEAPTARLELVIDAVKSEWRLFAEPGKHLACNDPIREYLSLPIARMRPEGSSLLSGTWQCRVACRSTVPVRVTASGDLVRSFKDTLGLSDFADTVNYNAYQIQPAGVVPDGLDANIFGTYVSCQGCLAAEGSLHVKDVDHDEESSNPMFFFLDPTLLEHPDEDAFIFSADVSRCEYGSRRIQYGKLDPKWRPQVWEQQEVVNEDKSITHLHRKVHSSDGFSRATPNDNNIIDLEVSSIWTDLIKTQLRPSEALAADMLHRVPCSVGLEDVNRSCQTAFLAIRAASSVEPSQKSRWQKGEWIEIRQIHYREFYAEFAWLMERSRNLPGLNAWNSTRSPVAQRCLQCAPRPPSITWKEGPKGQNIACESPKEAAVYERALKLRPSPLITQIFLDDSGRLELKLGVNPETLMHRASATLDSVRENVKLSWRLITDYCPPGKISLPRFTIMSNSLNTGTDNPTNFEVKLRPEQIRSLEWMKLQESKGGPAFIEEEVEEEVIAQIGWRLEGRAESATTVRGGILADHVGYGKTALILGLIDSQRDLDLAASKVKRHGSISLKATLILVPSQLTRQWQSEVHKFLGTRYNVLVIESNAQLKKLRIADMIGADIIIVNWTIYNSESYSLYLAQFAGVIEQQKNPGPRAEATWYRRAMVEVAEHVELLQSDFESLESTIERKYAQAKIDGQEAEAYIPSKRLRGKAYQLSKIKLSCDRKRKSDMISTDEEYSECVSSDRNEGILDGVQGSNSCDEASTIMQECERSKKGEFINTPCRREFPFGAKEIQKSSKKTGKNKGRKVTSATTAESRQSDYHSMQCPLLELFHFARVVVDEYTYATGSESVYVHNLKAETRWMLSATPALQDFADVKTIASFMGIKLGVDDFTSGVIKSSNVAALTKHQTKVEEFQSMKVSRSAAWHDNRHALAQRFLDQYVRSNMAEIGDIPGSLHLMPVVLPAAERAIYLELVQLVTATNFKFMRTGKAFKDNDRARRIIEVIGKSNSPYEALLKCASHFSLNDESESVANAPEACQFIVDVRTLQYDLLQADFKTKLRQTMLLNYAYGNRSAQFTSWKKLVKSNMFGDSAVTLDMTVAIEHMESMIQLQDRNKVFITLSDLERRQKHDSDYENDRPVWPESLEKGVKDYTNQLRQLSVELVSRKRCLRFFEAVRKSQILVNNTDKDLKLDVPCDRCSQSNLPVTDMVVVAKCGHVFCRFCVEVKSSECINGVCNVTPEDYQCIPAVELGVEDNTTSQGRHYGKKIEDIVSLVQQIPKDDYVLLFSQFKELNEHILSALQANGIEGDILEGRGHTVTSKVIQNFQNDGRKKVLLLNIGDASAAGSNLTVANHVIFVAPYLADSDHTYQAAMTQAEGRARRYGQTKPVHVYKFFSLKTIDVDIIQQREHKLLTELPHAPEPRFRPYDGFKAASFALKPDDGEAGMGTWGSSIAARLD